MICRWALIEGEMGSFLESVMDDEVLHVTDYFPTSIHYSISQFRHVLMTHLWSVIDWICIDFYFCWALKLLHV